MSNPVKDIIKNNKSFVYFHTHVITEATLQAAIDAGASLEIDIAVTPEGEHYIGHPLEFYKFNNMPPPQNLPLDFVLDRVYESGLFLAIDCKDVRALPKIKKIIERFGADRCQFHSWVDTLLFAPYPPEITLEPQWIHEDLPCDPVVGLHEQTGVPLVMAVRGLTQERLSQEGDQIIDKIIAVAKGKATSIYFFLPNFELPPMHFMERLLDNGLVTYFNVDAVPEEKWPRLYHGMTDYAERATKYKP
jgi:hypothetical protein